MRVIAIKTLEDFWSNQKYQDSEQSLKSWFWEIKKDSFKNPNDLKSKYRNASVLKNNRAVFNIKGNKYRLVTAIRYDIQVVFIRFIGTHEEYDKITAQTI